MVSKLSRKLISNVTYLTFDWVIATVFSLVYWIIVGKSLSPEYYGIVATVTGLVPFLSMLSMLGLSLALMKLIPEYSVRHKNKIKPLIKFSFKITTLTNLSILILFIIFSTQLSTIFKIDQFSIILSTIGIISMSYFFMSGSVVYGFQNMRKYFTSDLMGQITKVLITIATIYLGFLYYGPIIGLIAGFLVSLAMRFDFKWLIGATNNINHKILLKYSLSGLVSVFLTSVFTYYQYIILPIVQNQTTAGMFAVALRITTLIAMIPAVLINGLFPILSKLSAVKDSRRLQGNLLSNVFRYALFLILPISVLFMVFSKELVLLFSQTQYLFAVQLIPILAVASVVYGLGNISSQALYAIKKPNTFRNIAIASILTFFLTSIPLAYIYSSFGLAASYLLSALVLFIPSFYYINKNISSNVRIMDLIKIIIATLSFGLILLISENFTVAIKIAVAIIASAFYFLVLIPLKFYTEQDARLLKYLGHKIPFLQGFMSFLSNLISKE